MHEGREDMRDAVKTRFRGVLGVQDKRSVLWFVDRHGDKILVSLPS